MCLLFTALLNLAGNTKTPILRLAENATRDGATRDARRIAQWTSAPAAGRQPSPSSVSSPAARGTEGRGDRAAGSPGRAQGTGHAHVIVAPDHGSAAQRARIVVVNSSPLAERCSSAITASQSHSVL